MHRQLSPAQADISSSETPANPSESVDQATAESKAPKVEATDTVAVTKPEKSSVAATVQQSMAQAKTGAAATASDLAGKTKTTASAATAGAVQHQVAATTQAKKASTSVATGSTSVTKPVVPEKSAAAPVVVTSPTAAGDAIKGKVASKKCKTCHNFTAKKKVGPGLKGIFGRKAGVMPGMKYSASLAASGWVWDEKNLALWGV